jgi:hypothetical protein
MNHFYEFNRDEYMAHYHKRSNIESTNSMVRRKFGDHIRSRTDVAMRNEVHAKLLCHNLCCVILSQIELGIEPVFWKNEPTAVEAGPNVVRFPTAARAGSADEVLHRPLCNLTPAD